MNVKGMEDFSSYTLPDANGNANEDSNVSADSWSYGEDNISEDQNDDDADSSWPSYAIEPPEDNHLAVNDEASEQINPYSSFSIFPPEDDLVVGNEAEDENVSHVYFYFSLLQLPTLYITIILFYKLCRYMSTVKIKLITMIQRERRMNHALIISVRYAC